MDKFEWIRHLADRLDLQVGTVLRKQIMAGHELLTAGTSHDRWVNWLTAVSRRLRHVSGINSHTKEAFYNTIAELRSALGAPPHRV